MGNSNSGRFVWHELVTPDPKTAVGFYSELFGWQTRDMDMGPMGTYRIFSSNGTDVGGAVAPPPGANVPPSWLAYCSVDDVDAAAKKATSLGGTVMSPPMDIPGVGRFAVVLDPQGAALAPFKPTESRPEPEGWPPVGTFCWNDLASSDPKASVDFYTAIYGWTTEAKDMGPGGTYHLLLRGKAQAGGIMKTQMAGQPSSWFAYVAVANVDESAKRAESLKGKIVVPPTDIPGIGRFAIVADPQGALISLFAGSMLGRFQEERIPSAVVIDGAKALTPGPSPLSLHKGEGPRVKAPKAPPDHLGGLRLQKRSVNS